MNKVIHNGEVYLLFQEVLEMAVIAEEGMSKKEIEEDLSSYVVCLEGFGDTKFIKEEDNTYFISHTIHTSLEDMVGKAEGVPIDVTMDRFYWLEKILK